METRQTILSALHGATKLRQSGQLPRPWMEPAQPPSGNALIERFMITAVQNGMRVERAKEAADIPGLIRKNHPHLLKMGEICVAPALAGIDWSAIGTVVPGENNGAFAVGINRAHAGVARTGALVFFSNAATPGTINFLSRCHIALVCESEIVNAMNDVWETCVAPANAIHFISGPSSTGDIGGRLLKGIHGPLELICYIVEKRPLRYCPFHGLTD